MDIAIVKYNAGNICSVTNAMLRLGIIPTLTNSIEDLTKADAVLFPGQGEASNTMAFLRQHHLDEAIARLKQPVLGICIGQQLLCKYSEEGYTDCIGIFDVPVKRFQPQQHQDKVPAIGWNDIYDLQTDLYKNLPKHAYTYFVHSYYVPLCEYTIAKADYIQPFSASLHKDNFYTAQFHPEKSGKVGEQILHNFIDLACKR